MQITTRIPNEKQLSTCPMWLMCLFITIHQLNSRN